MSQKQYQKLRANLPVAEMLYGILKVEKVITEKRLKQVFCRVRGFRFDATTLSQNFNTVKWFLADHKLATKHNINGHFIWVATQKTARSKSFESATVETQEVLQSNIQKAIQYQEMNGGMVPAELEGTVIGNILELEGKHLEGFIKAYVEILPDYIGDRLEYLGKNPKKYAIVNPVCFPKEYGIKEKIVKIDDVEYSTTTWMKNH